MAVLLKQAGARGADDARDWLAIAGRTGTGRSAVVAPCRTISGGGLVLHFSGQGRHGFAEAVASHGFPTARRVIDACSAALSEEVMKPHVASTGYYPLGMNISGW